MTESPDKNSGSHHQNNTIDDTTNAPLDALKDVGLHEKITGIRSDNLSSEVNPGFTTFPVDKLAAHLHNVRHVAISIFVFDEHKLLLQKRADTKYHSGGLWANTVCSHPRWQEAAKDCAKRRLNEELGWSTELVGGDQIDYHTRVGNLYENEHVHCFYGNLATEPERRKNIEYLTKLINPVEVAALRWMSLSEIELALDSTPETFSAWFKIYMSTHKAKLQKMMEAASAI